MRSTSVQDPVVRVVGFVEILTEVLVRSVGPGSEALECFTHLGSPGVPVTDVEFPETETRQDVVYAVDEWDHLAPPVRNKGCWFG